MLNSSIPFIISVVSKDVGPDEFCWETFNATCTDNEVILLKTARYGRMRLGRCLTRDYYVGCSADVLHQVKHTVLSMSWLRLG